MSGEEDISDSFSTRCECGEWEERAWWGLIKLTQPPQVISKIMSFAQKQLLSLNLTCCCSLVPTRLILFSGAIVSVLNIKQGGTRRTGNFYLSPLALEQLSVFQKEEEAFEGWDGAQVWSFPLKFSPGKAEAAAGENVGQFMWFETVWSETPISWSPVRWLCNRRKCCNNVYYRYTTPVDS